MQRDKKAPERLLQILKWCVSDNPGDRPLFSVLERHMAVIVDELGEEVPPQPELIGSPTKRRSGSLKIVLSEDPSQMELTEVEDEEAEEEEDFKVSVVRLELDLADHDDDDDDPLASARGEPEMECGGQESESSSTATSHSGQESATSAPTEVTNSAAERNLKAALATLNFGEEEEEEDSKELKPEAKGRSRKRASAITRGTPPRLGT